MRELQRMVAVLLICVSALAGAQEAINIGQVASTTHPVTGPVARAFKAGIELALDGVNQRGGIGGRPLRLVTVDDEFDASKTAALVDDLVTQHRVIALVGNVGTPALMRLAQERKLEVHSLVSIAPVAGLQSALSQPLIFPIRASYDAEVEAMLRHAVNIGYKRIAFLAFDAGPGGPLAQVAPAIAERQGIKLVGPILFKVESDPKKQASALQAALEHIGSRPDAIVLIAAGASHGAAVKAVRERFGVLPLYTWGLVTAESVHRDVGSAAASGIMITQVMPAPTSNRLPILLEYQRDLASRGMTAGTDYTTLEGYVAGRIVAEIVRRSGNASREAVLRTALTLGEINVGGFRVTYSARQRQSLQPIEITMVASDGRLVR